VNLVRVLPVLLSVLLMAAHFSRADNTALVITSLLFPLVLLVRRPWAVRLTQLMLVVAGLEWVRTLIAIAGRRQALGEPWVRMAVILAVVAIFSIGSAAVFWSKELKKRYGLE
jgi:hypothetical protein